MTDNDIIIRGLVEARFFVSADVIELTSDLVYIIPANDLKVTVKAGFGTDGASIPPFFWRVVGHPFLHSFLRAAILHDALYQSEALPRRVCDRIFRDLTLQLARQENASCRAAGKPDGLRGYWRYVRAWLMWAAVRVFGGYVWRKHTASDVAAGRRLVSLS